MKKIAWNFIGISVCSVFLGVFVFLYFYHPVETEDIGFHLATGRWILENKVVPWTDPFAFSLPAPQWIFTQWLGSVIYYSAYCLGGFEGLKVFRSILFLGVFFLFWAYSRRKLPWPLLIFLIFMASHEFAAISLLRPFMFNLFFIQIYLWILFRHCKGQTKLLWLIPVCSVLWFNLHLGCFAYGLPLVLIFLLNEIINFLNLRSQRRDPAETGLAISKIKSLIFVALGCLFSFYISPYGLTGFMYPLETFLIPENMRLLFLNITQEQLPPTYIVGWYGKWFYIFVALALVMIWKNKKNRFLYCILFAVAFFLYLHGARGADFFITAMLCLVSELSEDLRWQERWQRWEDQHKNSLLVSASLSVVLLLNVVHLEKERTVITAQGVMPLNRLMFDPHNNIVGAVDFLKRFDIHGPVFDRDVDGGYLLWAGYPQLKIFLDGRKLDADMVYESMHVFQEPERYWPWAEEKYGFKIIILNVIEKASDRLISYIQQRTDWSLVFVEGANAVFLKTGAFRLPPEAMTLAERLRDIPLRDESWTKEVLPGVSLPRQLVRDFWQPPPYYVQANQEGMALFLLGYHAAGLNRVADALGQDWSAQTRNLYLAMRDELERIEQAKRER